MKILRNKHNTAKSLISVNIVAWTAGTILLFNNCPLMEEPLQTRIVEVTAQTASAKTSSVSPSPCTDNCVFRLKESPITSDVKTFWLASLGLHFAEIREKLAKMEARGMQPILTHNDPEITALIRAMVRLNEKAFTDYGFEPFQVSGPNNLERYRSLNLWLGRNQDAPMDDSTISALDLKVVEAIMQ
jgi:hypothetical protein